MKFLFASDSFKGSLTSEKTIELLSKAAHEIFPDCETEGVLIADGGEGTTLAVVKARGGMIQYVPVHGPLMEQETAFYGQLSDSAVIMEMASASGLPLVPAGKRNPLYTTTFGTGELLKAALEAGNTKINIAIGGSATNDGGMGFARALGVKFFDLYGKELNGCGEDLGKVHDIDLSGLNPLTQEAEINMMCDVENPLCGPDGATYTFGAQKGGTEDILDRLEEGMQNYRDVLIRDLGISAETFLEKGTGAAGGLGLALRVFLNAKMQSGIETVLRLIHFDEKLDGVDLVVTGEGCTDWQSSFGKAIEGVGEHAGHYRKPSVADGISTDVNSAESAEGIPVAAICGSLGKGYEKMYDDGIDSFITTVNAPMSLENAMADAEKLYYQAAVRLFRLIRAGMKLR